MHALVIPMGMNWGRITVLQYGSNVKVCKVLKHDLSFKPGVDDGGSKAGVCKWCAAPLQDCTPTDFTPPGTHTFHLGDDFQELDKIVLIDLLYEL